MPEVGIDVYMCTERSNDRVADNAKPEEIGFREVAGQRSSHHSGAGESVEGDLTNQQTILAVYVGMDFSVANGGFCRHLVEAIALITKLSDARLCLETCPRRQDIKPLSGCLYRARKCRQPLARQEMLKWEIPRSEANGISHAVSVQPEDAL